MGNCPCSKVEERYTSDEEDLNSVVERILSDILTRRSLDLAADTDGIETETEDDSEAEGNSVGPSNISFENESIVSRLEQIYVEEDTCAICAFNYDEIEHVPRILPCGHTICKYCIRKMASKSKRRYVECPMDRKRHKIKPQHTVRQLYSRSSSSVISIARESINTDMIYGGELPGSDSNSLDDFEQTSVDSASNEVSERSILDISLFDRVNMQEIRHDIYDDERSVRSFQWVEPDYSSESE